MIGERITVVLTNNRVVELRPSLRHALWLDRREGGLAKLIVSLDEGSITAATEIVSLFYAPPNLATMVRHADRPQLREGLARFAIALTGLDEAAPKDPRRQGKTVSFGEYLLDLYRLGTGWLGWTPEQTLDATPTEITEAFRGRQDMLKAIFGGADDDKPTDDRPLDDKIGGILRGIGTVKEAA